MDSQKNKAEIGYMTISCPRCNKKEIRVRSGKNSHIFKICLSCREKENKRRCEEMKDIINSRKRPEQTIKDAMRQYIKSPKSIKITAARKKRYRNAKWLEQKIKEKMELGLLGDEHDLRDIKTVQKLILQIYGLDEEDAKRLTRTWKKIIRILAIEIIARRAFVPLEKKRKNIKRPDMASIHKQSGYKTIAFMLCK